MKQSTSISDERGQAYTLEGFISAMVVLMALLFALQSVVITPTTGGVGDRTVKAQMEQEAQDALVISANDTDRKSLNETILDWEDSQGTFKNADITSEDVRGHYNASDQSHFYSNTSLGKILYERFAERGMSYNVELVYWNEGENRYESEYLVYQGEAETVTASYMVTIFDGQEPSDSNYPIAQGTKNGSNIYNVVEVRVAVW